jgi:predicted membrane protein DUF2207
MRRSLLTLLVSLIAMPAFAKSLYWRTFDVTARLDSDGRLHVREQQGMVFDGDWNGGERRFNIRPGQSLDLARVVRVENGQDVPLVRGDLSQVDHWDFAGDNVVRWRSRRPSDPPFQNQQITYAIEYVLSGILQRSDGGAHLHHDFAFPDRAGVIENFTLHLDLDPAWHGLPSPYILQRRTLPAGESVIVDTTLTYTGHGSPITLKPMVTKEHATVIILLLLAAGIGLTWKFYVDNKHQGRSGPLFPIAAIDERWLNRYVFSLPPEVVGYAWDEENGAPEVAAMIARMEQEKKLHTWITHDAALIGERTVLHLKLLADWETLPAGEKELVQALFLGKTESDTDQIRAYYRTTGFRPQQLIQKSIDDALLRVPEWNGPTVVLSGFEILLLVVIVFGGYILLQASRQLWTYIFFAGAISVLGISAAIAARKRVDRTPWTPVVFAWGVIFAGAVIANATVGLAMTDFAAAAMAMISAFIAAFILLVSRSRESIAKVAFRRRLAAARQFFEKQLASPNPKLQDAWYPYLIALGLGPNVDRWFKNFSQASSGLVGGSSHTSSFGSSSSPSATSWTGGGGAFGGAGATGSWAAMSVLAGGVATPGSSGGFGGGGGGGSGGGGGGGW